MSHLSRSRRAAALVAAPVLALGVLASPAQAGDAQAENAANYLSGNLDNGVFNYLNFGAVRPDFGGSIDAAIAFDQTGGHSADITAIAGAISSRLTDYTDYAYNDIDYNEVPATGTKYDFAGRAAGGTAKAIVALELDGRDPTAQPGGDLVARLEGMLEPAPSAGVGERIVDDATRDGADYPAGNFANTLGQSFAVTALRLTGSSHADDVAAYLSRQQCSVDGYFAAEFVASGAQCSDTSQANTDATALVASAFVPIANDPNAGQLANEAVLVANGALNFFQATQRTDGGFGEGPGKATNANSTGLAVAALRQIATIPQYDAAATPLAVKGAAWLRAHQLDNVGTCTPYDTADLGAVAYDDDARSGAAKDGITATAEGQFIKATAQSAEGLLSAPSDPSALTVAGPTTYVADGSVSTIRVTGAAPGSAVCLSTGQVQKNTSVTGSVSFPVRAPARTATTTFTFTGVDGAPARVAIKSLAAKTLSLAVRSKVANGGTQRAIVTGLAPGEKVSVRFGGKTVKSGTATSKGVYNVTFKVSSSAGTRTVSVAGQFSDRKAAKSFTVTR